MLLTKESAVYKIFYWPFRFRIPYHNLIDYESAEKFGVRGNPEAAREQALAMVDVLLTINQMVDYYREGATLQLVQLTDAKAIYEILYDHLAMWVEAFDESPWSYRPPLKDLKLMSEIGEDMLAMSLNHCPQPDIFEQMLLIREPDPVQARDQHGLFAMMTTIEDQSKALNHEY